MKNINSLLFREDEIISWKKEWQNMPEFSHDDLAPKYQIIVNFATASDVEDFAKLIGQKIKVKNGKQRQSVWFPDQDIDRMINKRYIEE